MSSIDLDFISQLNANGISVEENISGSALTTYRVGGNLKFMITLTSRDDINKLAEILSSSYTSMFTERNAVTIGNGSNLLISDSGFDGCVFKVAGELCEINGFSAQEDKSISVTVGAGMSLPAFARQCGADSISGLEFYVGIPGTVGGAVAMNAGGHGKQTSEVLVSCNVLDLTKGIVRRYSNQECNFSYRHSVFKPTDLVFSAQYRAEIGDALAIKAEIDSIVQWRRANQPGGRNVGSVFQNPEGISAGALIEKCDLKGFRIGSAQVSDKHANFIQADENASSADIKALISHVQSVVRDLTGHELVTEVRYIPRYEDG